MQAYGLCPKFEAGLHCDMLVYNFDESFVSLLFCLFKTGSHPTTRLLSVGSLPDLYEDLLKSENFTDTTICVI